MATSPNLKSLDRVNVAMESIQTHSADRAGNSKNAMDASEIERITSPDDLKKDHQDYNRMDAEVAKYTNSARIEISSEDNRRLKKLIDRRVLAIMIFTYFLQALDKGTMSFASIMGIREDLGLLDSQKYSWLTTCIYIAVLTVE